MYFEAQAKSWGAYWRLLRNRRGLQSGVRKVLAGFGIDETDVVVDLLLPNTLFKLQGVPDVLVKYTTSRPEDNADFPDETRIQQVTDDLANLFGEFFGKVGIKTYEIWPGFWITHWFGKLE